MCGATVQSMNHVRAMTETQFNPETEEIENIKRDMKPKKNKPRLVRDLLLGLMDFIVINI